MLYSGLQQTVCRLKVVALPMKKFAIIAQEQAFAK